MKFRERSSRSSDKRGYSLNGKTVTLHVTILGSIPNISKAREAQLVERNIEAILVISSSLISSIKGDGEIGKHWQFRSARMLKNHPCPFESDSP
jgi:hypothetical protein